MKYLYKLCLIFTALAFTFNSFGFVLFYIIELENAKEEAFEMIENLKDFEKAEILSFSPKDFEKGNSLQRINKKEIRFDGKMYDIVKEVIKDGKIVFYCVHDEKEDKLDKEFGSNIHKSVNHKSTSNPSTHNNNQSQYADYGNLFTAVSSIQKLTYTVVRNENYNSNDLIVLTPPPKII